MRTITRTIKVLWYILVLCLAAYQVVKVLQLRREGVTFFHTTTEMILVIALVAVIFVGIFVKSRLKKLD
jgi:hypothetical protein